MKINCLSDAQNYTNRFNAVKNGKSNAITFGTKTFALKTAMVTAPLVLATMGVVMNANAQTINKQDNEIVVNNNHINANNIDNPFIGMGKYFEEHGFTPEQRATIADYTKDYAENYNKEFNIACENAYYNYHKAIDINDFPANPLGLNYSYNMGKIEEHARVLTNFRQDMISAGAISDDKPNPILNPIEDCKEIIQNILGEGVNYEQYVEDNAEIIEKLNDIDLITLLQLSDSEKTVFNKLKAIFNELYNYINNKHSEYIAEADKEIVRLNDAFINDINNLSIFRAETDNMKNTFIECTQNDVLPQFEYPATNKSFVDAVIREYVKILIEQAADIKNIQNSSKNSKIYDLNGRILSHPQKGINIMDGKKVIIK